VDDSRLIVNTGEIFPHPINVERCVARLVATNTVLINKKDRGSRDDDISYTFADESGTSQYIVGGGALHVFKALAFRCAFRCVVIAHFRN
jgi:hypothetical protein